MRSGDKAPLVAWKQTLGGFGVLKRGCKIPYELIAITGSGGLFMGKAWENHGKLWEIS